jgi:hypothetical protein
MRTAILLAAGLTPVIGTAILMQFGVTALGLVPAIAILMIPIILLTRQPKQIKDPDGYVVVDHEAVRAASSLGIGAFPISQIAGAHIVVPPKDATQQAPYWVLQDTSQRQLNIFCTANGADDLQQMLLSFGADGAQISQAATRTEPGVVTILSLPGAMTPRLTADGLIWGTA